MSDTPKLSNRIPFEEIQEFTSWNIPSVGQQHKVVPSAQREAQKAQGFRVKGSSKPNPKAESQTSVEDVEEAVQPMTAEQLQQIADTAEREGREQGYAEGYKKGFSEGEKKGVKLGEKKGYQETKTEMLEQTARFKNIADELLAPLELQNSALENLVVEMAMQFAKRLINKELSEDPRSLFSLVEKAVGSLPAGANNIRVFLCEDDIELVHEAFENSGRNWQFYVDSKLSRGGCRVESDQSLVDYSIEKRMQALLDEASLSSELSEEDLMLAEDYSPGDEHEEVNKQEAKRETASADSEEISAESNTSTQNEPEKVTSESPAGDLKKTAEDQSRSTEYLLDKDSEIEDQDANTKNSAAKQNNLDEDIDG